MGYTNFKNNEEPALNDENLKKMQIGLMELVFPIGSIYITQEDVNPITLLEFGTWERSKGKVFVGLDEDDENFNEIGKTGGESSHTLNIAEMPEHNHGIGINYDVEGPTNYPTSRISSNIDYPSVYTGKNGEGQAHNNLQPYEVVGYMWIRRA